MKVQHSPELPLARRFHRRGGQPLRSWERAVFSALYSTNPERRLWANVLADALYVVYRFTDKEEFLLAWEWLMVPACGSPLEFETVADAFDINVNDLRRDVRRDYVDGRMVRTSC